LKYRSKNLKFHPGGEDLIVTDLKELNLEFRKRQFQKSANGPSRMFFSKFNPNYRTFDSICL
jgi:hypothetical protein